MSGQDLYIGLQKTMTKINAAIDSLASNGKKLALAERDYRVALRQEILKERAGGMPVSIISDICRGDDHIADLKMARDCAESNYEANNEAIQAWKLQARLIESQIDREWNRKD